MISAWDWVYGITIVIGIMIMILLWGLFMRGLIKAEREQRERDLREMRRAAERAESGGQ